VHGFVHIGPIRVVVLRALGDGAPVFSGQHAGCEEGGRGKVTAIDPGADIQFNPGTDEKHADYVTARIPLAGHVTPEWLRCYRQLVDETHPPLTARAEDEPDRSWIVVRVPATITDDRLLQVLDAACDLIPKADAAEQAPPPTARAEAIVREWWAARRG
jgi:hypothetical protein